MSKVRTAINWNKPSNKFFDDLYVKQTEQFWLPEEIPVSEDKSEWEVLEPQYKEAYEKILAGLTLLDTEQTCGIANIGEKSNDLFVKSVFTLFAGFETIHARSYSTIFQTLCTENRIDELFTWVEENKHLQSKVETIVSKYEGITDEESFFLALIASLCLEGICFYSGFFLPLWLSGQGKMINSGEIINLILRDEKLHTVGVGFLAKRMLESFPEEINTKMQELAFCIITETYENEVKYSEELYQGTGLLEDVKTYIQFNVNYACDCAGLGHIFENITEKDVNPIVMNGYSTETKNHDFFSNKGNGYIKTSKVEQLEDEDFLF